VDRSSSKLDAKAQPRGQAGAGKPDAGAEVADRERRFDGTPTLARGNRAARTHSANRCKGRTKLGGPCAAPATQGDYCYAHSGKADMAALGRKGGQQRTRNLLGIDDSVADDKLRSQAKKALEEALASDNEQVRLRAAQSLYSYRAQAAPSSERLTQEGGAFGTDGRRVISLADVLELATDRVQGAFDDARTQDVILRAADRVRELQAAGVRVGE